MPLSFAPKTDQELTTAILLPEGTYDFEVVKAIEKTSKNGNPMIELNMKIWDSEGAPRYIYDYLMTNNPRMEFKLKNFCKATGLIEKYDSGNLGERDCVEKCGKVRVKIFSDKTGQYPDKNVISEYIVADTTAAVSSPADLDDDIPF